MKLEDLRNAMYHLKNDSSALGRYIKNFQHVEYNEMKSKYVETNVLT